MRSLQIAIPDEGQTDIVWPHTLALAPPEVKTLRLAVSHYARVFKVLNGAFEG
jgi:hypothetical protein